MTDRRGPIAWTLGAVVLVVLLLMLPTTVVEGCGDPGGCQTFGTDAWTGLVRWPFSSSWAVSAYWLATVALAVALVITAARSLRHRSRT